MTEIITLLSTLLVASIGPVVVETKIESLSLDQYPFEHKATVVLMTW